MKKKLPNNPTFELEEKLFKQGYKRIIGIDEAGRGCWAGPVSIGAFFCTQTTKLKEGVKDSKLITPQKRSKIFATYTASEYRVYYATPAEIDEYGIAKVIEKIIASIIKSYNDSQTYFLIDGRFSTKFLGNNTQIIKGDRLHYSIAAASIAAKVSRDLLMQNLSTAYQVYGFEKHKGYGTKGHYDALVKFGISDQHRRSFEPIKSIIKNGKPKTISWEKRGRTGLSDTKKTRFKNHRS